jgi:glycosyltransferase involved in cell wall biosynthesis
MQMYNMILGVPYREAVVIKNGIDPIEIEDKELDGTVRIIYHTTPHRGLELLVPVFEELAKRYKNIHLDVYSSFSIYGWNERDAPYLGLFERCKNHPQITYHGAVTNEEVREALKKSHIFAYPSIWPETSCLAAIEALSAKNIVVCPNYAALPETTAGFANMYQWHENPNDHAGRFLGVLDATIKEILDNGFDQGRANFQKSYTDAVYSWEGKAKQWKALLEQLAQQEQK